MIALLVGTALATLIAPPLLFVLLFYFLLPFLLIRHLVRSCRAPAALRRFVAAPWCLWCRYPIPVVHGGADICPECGEPIPPEIARLTAQGLASERRR